MTIEKLKYALCIVLLVWTLLFGILFIFSSSYVKQSTRELAYSQAQAYFNKDVAFRKWVARHGGLYVPITKKTPPSPYLSHIPTRDIRSSDGTPLTLLNPAYATRQLNEMFTELYGVTGHITSLKLLRPENSPDRWEQAALKKFEQGEKEVYGFIHIDGEPFLRLIQPILIQHSCLKCHGHQEYDHGDVRGGVGISLPMAPFLAKEQTSLFGLKILLGILWLLGSSLILWGGRGLIKANLERDDALQSLETLFQKSGDGILLIQDGQFIDCNEAAVKMLGYGAKDEILRCHPAALSPGVQADGRDSYAKAEEQLQICLDHGTNRFEWLHQNTAGELFWVEVVLTLITLQNKPVIHVSWRDINLLKQSQQELANYQDNLEELLAERTEHLEATQSFLNKSQEIAHVGSWHFNLQTKALIWSDEVFRILGYTPHAFEPSFDVFMAAIHPDDRKNVEQAYAKAVSEHSLYDITHRIVLPDGTIRHVFEKSEEMVDEGGVTVFSTGMIQDITEQVQAEEALQQAMVAANAASQAKSDFLANMSHEIRTPMNALLGLSELTLQTTLTDQQYDYVSKINVSSQGLLTILNDILDYSKIEAGKLDLESRPFSLPETIDEVGSLFVDQAQEKGLDLKLKVADNVPSFLLGDANRLRQVLVNLMGNGLKFTHQGGVMLHVFLHSLIQDQAALKFTVTDSGIGIPAEKCADLFESFCQVDASHSRKYGGTGLGLTISKQLVEMMGGDLVAHSEEGKGSEFSFILPFPVLEMAETGTLFDPAAIGEAERQKVMAQIAGVHLLLVEDNAINKQIAQEFLAHSQISVEIAWDGQEAVDKYRLHLEDSGRNRPFAAILMDIQMPHVDGYRATQAIREMEKDLSCKPVPIIAMTAHAMNSDREKCLSVGMDDYISKPLDSTQLFVTLARWVEGPQQGMTDLAPLSDTHLSSKELDGLLIDFPDTLAGINLKSGLARLEGNSTLYRNLLKQFAVEFQHAVPKMHDLWQRYENKSALRLIHTIKGLAGNLGAESLQSEAVRVETALQDNEHVVETFERFSRSLQEVLDSIALLEEMGCLSGLENKASATVDSATLAQREQEFLACLKRKDFLAVKIWPELKLQWQDRDCLEQIDQCLASFDFDKAREIFESYQPQRTED